LTLKELKEKLFQQYLIWNCRPTRIAGYLQNRLPPPGPAKLIDRRRIRVAALQLELKLLRKPLEYVDEMHRHTRKAAGAGADLAVFPEYNNLPLLGLLPGIDDFVEADREKTEGKKRGGNDLKGDQAGEDINMEEIYHYMSPAVQPLVHAIFSRLAKAYSMHIMAGSYTLADNGRVINRAFLYGPAGDLLGSQDKVHLLPLEMGWNLKCGSAFKVFETALGRLAMPVCMDATYYETFRILEHKKADIALLPVANPEEYNYWLALRGIWPRVQESLLYGVKSALVGSIGGMIFSGRSGIFAPLELTPRQDGVLAEVDSFDREAIAIADLDLQALHELRREHPWRDSNPELYRCNFPKIYRDN
jgi:predicted amidohydrolase